MSTTHAKDKTGKQVGPVTLASAGGAGAGAGLGYAIAEILVLLFPALEPASSSVAALAAVLVSVVSALVAGKLTPSAAPGREASTAVAELQLLLGQAVALNANPEPESEPVSDETPGEVTSEIKIYS